MPLTVQEMLEAANSVVQRISAAQARELLQQGALLLDVRDAPELEKTGRAVGSHHISRGMLEFRADPALQSHDPELRKDRPIILHCASGGRAALAGKLLKDMGYQHVYNLGGFSDWVNGGGDYVGPVDSGM
ncbi:rhodanese-like domain-containing protein [Ruegeria arenilitoris]|uniref:rhodanese-like domain-containing protein n=1 Tax=Ruegeria arenilitoris TaxID=1173585 RepID=UPI00147A86CD|nr:rhodanese-like domain-containing protein [Ruegeria arenilitoris]